MVRPATSRSVVEHSTDWANPAAIKTILHPKKTSRVLNALWLSALLAEGINTKL